MSDGRPTDPRTGLPIGPLEQPGYYPGFHTLDQQKFWDAHTREVVLDRVHNVPLIRFFTPDEARLMEAVCAHLLPQDDRDEAHRIPIVPRIDERLFSGRIDGYRYEGMPPDTEAYRLGLQAIEEIAQHVHGKAFTDLDPLAQDIILKSIHDGKPAVAQEIWRRMPIDRFWSMLLSDCAEMYYSHPWAWDEIGFGGPAYPRAYMRLEGGQPEPWEKDEQRYEWNAPETSVSDLHQNTDEGMPEYGHPGQGGTH